MEQHDHLLDQPITSEGTDILGFSQVACSLAESIKAQPNSTSLTLGLDGAWGSGKTSILKLLQQTIETDNPDDGIGLVVVPFSPWLITNRTALVSSFFAQLGAAIDESTKKLSKSPFSWKKSAVKKLKKSKKQLNRFSSAVSIVSSATSTVDPTLISAATAGGAKALKKLSDVSDSDTGETLESLKEELKENLRDIAAADPTFQILVLIDDLDRLDPDDALEVLRLVKAVGDFPATTYLLAYDRKAVAAAIEHSVKIDDGDVYLEKIIQFSFKVPPPEPFQLRYWLRDELEKLFTGKIDFETDHALAVLDTWAGRLLGTPRDVKRLLFAVRALWSQLEGRVDPVDLIWLQLIAQKASSEKADLYSWVVGYLQALEAVAIGGHVSGEKQERAELEDILKTLGWKTYEHDEDGTSFDFHYLNRLLLGVTTSYLGSHEEKWTYKITDDDLQKYRDGMRLSSPWHWRLYFALDEPSHAITDDEWRALKSAAAESTEDLKKSLAQILDFRGGARKDAADQIIERAIHEQKSNKLDCPERWLVAIVQQYENLADYSKRDRLFGFTRFFPIHFRVLAKVVFKTLAGDERTDTIDKIFNRKETVCVAAHLLRDLHGATTKTEHEKEEKLYLSEDELADVIEKQLAIYGSLEVTDLNALSAPYDVLYAWRDVTGSSDGPGRLLERAMKNDADLIVTLNSLKYVSSSAQNGVPHIPEGFLHIFMDTEALKSRLEKLSASESEHAADAAELLGLWWSMRE